MEKETEHEIRSEEVQDVLSAVPNWMIRWGITVIFGILIIGLFLSWLIKYPKTLNGEVTITTAKPPVNLVTKVNGQIASIYVTDGQLLKAGDPIAEIESSTKLENVHFIKQTLNELGKADYQNFNLNTLETDLVLGDAQQGFNQLVKALFEYQHFEEDKEADRKASFLQQKVRLQQDLVQLQGEQLKMLQSELGNKEEKWQAWKKLYADSSIARFELLQVENEFLQKKREHQALEKQLVQNKYSLVELKEQHGDLELGKIKRERLLLETIEERMRSLNSLVEGWEKSYIIKAPHSGKLAYVKNINENDFVKMGEHLFAIFSKDDSLFAYAKVPMTGAGKIENGQSARIALNAFPREEFGIIEGKVISVAPLSSESGYFVRMMLSDRLTTSYKKDIPFRPELSGTVEIIVDKRRLIYRVFDSIYKLFDDID